MNQLYATTSNAANLVLQIDLMEHSCFVDLSALPGDLVPDRAPEARQLGCGGGGDGCRSSEVSIHDILTEAAARVAFRD